ncbi:MAG: hypothetical protein HKN13_09005 [Rhodothermales bacterium]|nr:hypothetical protein [Rhodothermales bacterium]
MMAQLDTDGNGVTIFYRRGYETSAARRTRLIETTTRYLAVTTVPLILVVTVRMLIGLPVLTTSLIGFLVALAATVGLTYFRLYSTPARVLVTGDAVAIEDALFSFASRRRKKRAWFRVLDSKTGANEVTATVGLESYRFNRSDWSEFDALRDKLGELSTSHRSDTL